MTLLESGPAVSVPVVRFPFQGIREYGVGGDDEAIPLQHHRTRTFAGVWAVG